MDGTTAPIKRCAPSQLRGRRPRDYFEFLEARAAKVYGRVWAYFLVCMREKDWADDCTNDALIRLTEYKRPLELAPAPLSGEPTEEWYKLVEDALVNFALTMSKAVIANFFRKNINLLAEPEETADGVEDARSSIELNIEESSKFYLHSGFIVDLKKVVMLKQKTLIAHILDHLGDAADAESAIADVFRGEAQLDNKCLLDALLSKYPADSWDMLKLQKSLNQLRYYAGRLKEEYTEKGLLIFGPRPANN
jgi:hypothetical protein